MENISEFITDNPQILIGTVAAVSVVILVLLIISGIKRGNKKKKLLQDNPNMVQVEFDAPVYKDHGPMGRPTDTGYVVYSVNGSAPDFFSRTVLVPAGQVSLDCEYFTRSRIGKSQGRDIHVFTAAPGKKYIISFDLLAHKMKHKEK